MDKRTLAKDCYITALRKCCYLTEALDALLQHEMLMVWEEKDLISQIMPTKQVNEIDMTVLKFLYEQKLKKYYSTSSSSPQHPEMTPSNNTQFLNTLSEKIKKNEMKLSSGLSSSTTVKGNIKTFGTPATMSVMSPASRILYDLKNTSTSSFSIQMSLSRTPMHNTSRTVNSSKMTSNAVKNEKEIVTNEVALKMLDDSVDVKVAKAEEFFYNCEYKKCLKIVTDIVDRDPYHKRTLFVQIGCLMELKDANGKMNYF